MLIEFVGWWAQQMRSLAPQMLGRRDGRADALVVRSLGGLDVEVATRRRGVEASLTRVKLDLAGIAIVRRDLARVRRKRPVVLALPPSMLLEQEASLPIAAERSLDQVLRHEMDRLTPFRAAELFWAWRVGRRDPAHGTISVHLAFVPQAALRALFAGLAEAGLAPGGLEIASNGVVQEIGLAPPGGRKTGGGVVGAACAGLAIASLAIPVLRQERAIAAVDDQIEAVRPRVAVVDALRRKLQASTSGADVFAVEAVRVGDALQALAAVTQTLPDDSYLNQFGLHERKLTLSGRSAAAARLIGTLSTDPALRDPAFAAPVTRTGGDRGDQFTIRAELAR